jgi:hypothetical protein
MEFGEDQGAVGPDSRQGFVQSCPFLFLPVTAWSTLIRSWGVQTPKQLAMRCQVLFVGGDLGVADDLRGQVQLSRLSNLGGTVSRAGYTRIQVSSVCDQISRSASAGGGCRGGGPAYGQGLGGVHPHKLKPPSVCGSCGASPGIHPSGIRRGNGSSHLRGFAMAAHTLGSAHENC